MILVLLSIFAEKNCGVGFNENKIIVDIYLNTNQSLS